MDRERKDRSFNDGEEELVDKRFVLVWLDKARTHCKGVYIRLDGNRETTWYFGNDFRDGIRLSGL